MFVKVKNLLINVYDISTVESPVRVQDPDAKDPKNRYNDAGARVRFRSGNEPVVAFGAEAEALLATIADLSRPGKPAAAAKDPVVNK